MNNDDKALRELYRSFAEEMDSVELPSDEALHNLLDNNMGRESQGSKSPLIPARATVRFGVNKRFWLSIAASMLLLVVGGGCYLFFSHNDNKVVYLAENSSNREPDLSSSPSLQQGAITRDSQTEKEISDCHRGRGVRVSLPSQRGASAHGSSMGSPAHSLGGSPVASMAEPPDDEEEDDVLETATPSFESELMTIAIATDTTVIDSLLVFNAPESLTDTPDMPVAGHAVSVVEEMEKTLVDVKDSTIKQEKTYKAMKSKSRRGRAEKKKKYFWEQRESKDKNVNNYPTQQYRPQSHQILQSGGRFNTVYY